MSIQVDGGSGYSPLAQRYQRRLSRLSTCKSILRGRSFPFKVVPFREDSQGWVIMRLES